MMRADALNLHVYPVRTEMTDPSLHVCSTDKIELKEFIVNKTLLQRCSMDKDKSKGIIVETWSTADDESESKCIIISECPTEEDKLDHVITKKKTQIMRLHMMCRNMLTPLTYSNAEESFGKDLTCHTK